MEKIRTFFANATWKEIVFWIVAIVVGVPVIFSILGIALFDSSVRTMSGIVSQNSGTSGIMMKLDSGRAGGSAESYAVSDRVIAPSLSPIYETPASSGVLPADKKVIRNGSLDLLVKKAEEAIDSISKISDSYKGFIQNSNIYEVSSGVKSGNIVVRIPADSFAKAMDDIKKLAVKVQRENTDSSDVTAQYVDLEAQLKNYKVEEKQYLEIMARASKIDDILNVSSRLADVRGRIERTQGQLNYLSRQVGMSTISVSLTSEAEVEVFGIVWRPLTILKQALKNLLSDLTEFINYVINLVFKLPVMILYLALWGAIIWLAWIILRWAKRKILG